MGPTISTRGACAIAGTAPPASSPKVASPTATRTLSPAPVRRFTRTRPVSLRLVVIIVRLRPLVPVLLGAPALGVPLLRLLLVPRAFPIPFVLLFVPVRLGRPDALGPQEEPVRPDGGGAERDEGQEEATTRHDALLERLSPAATGCRR